MKLCLTVMVAALALVSPVAFGQATNPAFAAARYGMLLPITIPPRASNVEIWRIRVASLRREALKLQTQDGGKLTSEHYEMLQAKLDRINAEARVH